MLKRIFKGIVYFLGICTLICILAAACEDEETTYIEHTGPNEAVLVVPEEPDSEVEIVVPETTVTPESKEDFVFIEGPECVFGEFGHNMTGVLKNNSDKDFDYVQLSFSLFDAQGNVVDTAFTNITNLKSGRTWKFEAMFFEDNVASWELDEITGW